MLKLNSFVTRFDWFICYGGDQTLFITKEISHKINGFDADMQMMEDFDIVSRARRHFRYTVMKGKVLVSARKYETNSWFRVQKANRTIVSMYRKGIPQEKLIETHKKMLDYR